MDWLGWLNAQICCKVLSYKGIKWWWVHAPGGQPTPEQSFFPSKNRDVHTLLSVTLKQIKDAIAGGHGKLDFSIDGVDVSTVKLVGIVNEFVARCTDATFILDDGTGRVECNRWCHDKMDNAEMEQLSDGMYVRVHGRLTTFQGKKIVQVFSVRPVDDFDEIASHFIECMCVHLYNSKLPKAQVGVGVTTQPYMTPNQKPQVSVAGPSHPYMTIPPNQVFGQRILEERISQILNHPSYLSSVEGAHVQDIARELKVPVKDIQGAADNLAREGFIYQTLDLHFKSLVNGG